jgi:hypothetical protein
MGKVLWEPSEAERTAWMESLTWGKCVECRKKTQTRVIERENGIPNGREWFVCPDHTPE